MTDPAPNPLTMVGSTKRRAIWLARSEDLTEGSYLKHRVLYRGVPGSVIVLRHRGTCRAYRNLCVHMPRELDCESKALFERSGKGIRCSMHGIVYDFQHGASISTMCHGEKLTAVAVREDDDGIWLVDKRVSPMPQNPTITEI